MVSYNHKPDKLTLEQWQVELRRMQAKKDMLDIHEVNNKSYPGYYNVTNAITHKGYRVVYRGACSGWNFCSCMDFKTNQLGTCKHLEAVGQWLELRNRQPYSGNPPHTSLYLSYKGERKIYLRIGTDDTEAFRELARGYFTHDGVLREDAQLKVGLFIKKAQAINNTFRIYSDAMAYLIKSRADMTRVNSLDEVTSDQRLDSLLKTKLYPYQKEGIRFAYRAGSSIIADEMGLGKTLQAIGVAQLMKAQGLISSVLILCPTSLKYQWKKEIEKFTDDSAVVVEGTHIARKKLYQASEFYKIVSYNSLSVDIKALKSLRTDFLIMDEVQRLKNWNTQISKAARRVESDYTVVLSGTPLENKLDELYSITQFVDQYCLGPYYKFVDETTIKSETGKIVGYKNLNAVGERLKNTLIRRRRKDVALQLPPRQDETIFVPMTSEQRRLHDEYKVVVAGLVHKWARAKFLSEGDRRRLLLMLNQMRMLCDSTYVLDQESRNDTKVDEAVSIIVNHLESGIEEKVVVFSQWERMTRLISGELDKLGIGYEYLHGGVPSKARKDIVDNFTDKPESRVFISTDAGSTGLNLQVASLVINLDLPWNPAILEQRISRIYRLGQERSVQVINLVAAQTIEERMLATLDFKSSLFEGILDNGDDVIFLENSKLDKIMEDISIVTETPLPQVVELKEIDIIEQGVDFMNNLSKVLSSQAQRNALIERLVVEDEESGRAYLNIPVPSKESVKDLLGAIGRMLESRE